MLYRSCHFEAERGGGICGTNFAELPDAVE
jgi:hypothetical protein